MSRARTYMALAKIVFISFTLLMNSVWAVEKDNVSQPTTNVNTITAIDLSLNDNQQRLHISFKQLLSVTPTSFMTQNPPRLVVDFPSTTNATGLTRRVLESGDVRHVDIIQVADRTRLVVFLKRPLAFSSHVQSQQLLVRLFEPGSSSSVTAKDNSSSASTIAAEKNTILDIDFRRGSNDTGRIIIDLAKTQSAVDVRRQGQTVVIDFMKTSLPDVLRRRLDVKDFGTPVQTVSTNAQSDMVRMVIEPSGLWEHMAWQTDRRLIVEIRPIKNELGKSSSGGRGYRGEKLSLNFQNIEVRALLQVIADFTGLNVVASDSVSGQLTLRLKDVPWDQALDIVMQARGLDMRRNGNVLWIAPKDELLTKERLELEQRAQISELEPLVTETFQLNYQKADAFRQVFGLDGQVGRGSILSRRGSASSEPRTNKLFITDTPSRLDEVRKLILLTDVPTRQVMIEARIVEADDKFSKNLGVKLGFTDLNSVTSGAQGVNLPGSSRLSVAGNYAGVGERTGQITAGAGTYVPNSQFVNLPAASINGAAPGSLAVSLFSAGANRFLNLELSALEAEGKGKIISSPRVVTADQQAAIIEQGEEIPYQQATSSGATSIQFKKANLKLEVTPQITPDGNIILTVDVAKDSRGVAVGSSFAINTKHVKTNVQVENGGTVVLGGIFTQTEIDGLTKVPFFGDIPLLGHLFRNATKTRDRTELLIFITPHVVAESLVEK
ncbi:MAG: type IV pilus secretin PilQ [Oxalobacteraceae bacterium]|jgi:type IV pilus assembly protein PilQ|nr:type IV pilus secretin PilQ [Oxalobacteraceae bacterium]